jgi:hypothetical protein
MMGESQRGCAEDPLPGTAGGHSGVLDYLLRPQSILGVGEEDALGLATVAWLRSPEKGTLSSVPYRSGCH